MDYLGKLLRRSLSSRVGPVTKKSRADLTFKESFEVPSPYDVIDRNVPGIEQRLRFYEMRRLKEQLDLDKSDLDMINNENKIFEKNFKPNRRSLNGEITYRVLTYFPGLAGPSKDSSDSSVTLSIPIESLKISTDKLHKLFESLNITDKTLKYLNYTISDFPFISQNKSRALEILNEIIDLVKNGECSDFDNLSCKGSKSFKSYYNNDHKISTSSVQPFKPQLEFPIEWLPQPKTKSVEEL